MEPALRDKIEDAFPGVAVDKRHALQPGLERLPRFVAEHLLAAARGRRDPVEHVRDQLDRLGAQGERKPPFLARLMAEGQATLLGLLETAPGPEPHRHTGRLAPLDALELAVPEALAARHPELAEGGVWGLCELRCDPQARPPVAVAGFTPCQATRPDPDRLRRARPRFTTAEWLALLLTSAGYRPKAFPTRRLQLLLLSRLVPLAQENVNLVELGPRGTGKSYLLRSLGNRCHVLAGARASASALLYDPQRRRAGLIGRKQVVVFDEVGATTFSDRAAVAGLKDYMASGQLARGGAAVAGECSLLFTGNLDLDPDGRSPHRDYLHLFEALPDELCDPAVADRLHGFIPGWELPRAGDGVLADGVGLAADWFGAALVGLRPDLRFQDHLRRAVALEQASERDRAAVEKVASGLLKLVYPDGRAEEDGLAQVLAVAVELRQRVHAQLERMAPGEYRPKTLRFPGMGPAAGADLALCSHRLEDQDVEANGRAQAGKITILTVGDRGGGDVGYIECAHVPGRGLGVTGLRGPILDQSVRAAYDALLNLGDSLGLPAEALRRRKVSVHLVNMAEPKEGPSAGLAMALAMLSCATGRKVKAAVAVTGELSLHGNVGPVGGVAEKVDAARRHGRTTVLVPAANAVELARIPEVAGDMDVRPVRTFAEAVEAALEPAG